MTAERPEMLLAVVCAAVARASAMARANAAEHAKLLERGQIPPIELLNVCIILTLNICHVVQVEFPIELITDDLKFSLKVARTGPEKYIALFCIYEIFT